MLYDTSMIESVTDCPFTQAKTALITFSNCAEVWPICRVRKFCQKISLWLDLLEMAK